MPGTGPCLGIYSGTYWCCLTYICQSAGQSWRVLFTIHLTREGDDRSRQRLCCVPRVLAVCGVGGLACWCPREGAGSRKSLPSEAQEDKGALEAAGQFALSTQESGLWPPGGMGYPPGLMGQPVLATSPELSHGV